MKITDVLYLVSIQLLQHQSIKKFSLFRSYSKLLFAYFSHFRAFLLPEISDFTNLLGLILKINWQRI